MLASSEAFRTEVFGIITFAVENIVRFSLTLENWHHSTTIEQLIANTAFEAQLVVLDATGSDFLFCEINCLVAHFAFGSTTTEPAISGKQYLGGI
jgi:hypothetical protein